MAVGDVVRDGGTQQSSTTAPNKAVILHDLGIGLERVGIKALETRVVSTLMRPHLGPERPWDLGRSLRKMGHTSGSRTLKSRVPGARPSARHLLRNPRPLKSLAAGSSQLNPCRLSGRGSVAERMLEAQRDPSIGED